MLKKKLLLAALAVSSIGVMPLTASAEVGIYVDVAPPAARYEVVPAARPGYVWQPGFYDWRGGRHVWTKGYWVREKRGSYWHPSRWEQDNGRYHFVKGSWSRERYAMRGGDRDRDGIPNRVDRDKDGDGVPNYRDNAPNNPNRR